MAEVEGELALTAARALTLAGQWELADRLLASVQTSDQAKQAALALGRAQVAVELRQWRGTGNPTAAVDALIPAAADKEAAFDLSDTSLPLCIRCSLAAPRALEAIGSDGVHDLSDINDRLRKVAVLGGLGGGGRSRR